ncbi:MAG TPA: serine/threonine-protein kinase [Gemmatimonadales bacterium]|nr:serine/threonine-protein kinase [Gemmatimonadales bacterium]
MSSFLEQLQHALAPAYALGPEMTGAGMSRVFEATDVALGRKVVVKVLPPELAAGVNRDRFRREIQFAAQLQHPHIVPLLSAGEEGELLYYTMPFIEGESLRERLARMGPLPVRDVLRMLHDVVDALAYAHARGVVHRDIKPGNILTQGHHALVTDFGVAKAISAALPVAGMTTSGMAIGTPAYMAPEQLAADPAADHRVDLYAVGLLAYELLSGESPFTGKSPAATMAAQLTRDPEPIQALRGDVPPALSALIMRCLAKDPAGRPPTAAAMLETLEAIPLPSGPTTPTRAVPGRRAQAAAATTVATPQPAGPARPARPARRAVTLAAGGLLLAGAAAAAAVALRSGHSAAPAPRVAVMDGGAAPNDVRGAVTLNGVPVPPAPPPAPAARTLTREDSLAIASAVRKQLEKSAKGGAAADAGAGAGTAKTPSEGVRIALQERVIDSVVRASLDEWGTGGLAALARLRAAAPAAAVPPRVRAEVRSEVRARERAGRRTVLITEPPGIDRRPEFAKISHSLARDLRNAMREKRDRYVVSDLDSVRAALERGSSPAALADAFHPDLTASISVLPAQADSVVVLVKLRDLTAAAPWAYRVASSGVVAIEDAPDELDATIAASLAAIDEMSAAPRRDAWHPGQPVPAPPDKP